MTTLRARVADFLRHHAPHLVHEHHVTPRSFALALMALTFVVSAEQAKANAPAVQAAIEEAIAKAQPIVGLTEKAQYALVFEGEDIDGDGTADFANPTGKAVREHDDFGYGHFGASRDGGAREHEGVDYVGVAGQDVIAPIAGEVTRMGYAYNTEPGLKYVEITNAALGYKARVFYVNPSVAIGETVELGEKLGSLKTLQHKYAGITDHVHLELYDDGERVDATEVIVARRVRRTVEG